MYKTLLALLFSGISLLAYADRSYIIQAHIRDVKDGTVFFLKQFSTQRIINAMRLENGKLQILQMGRRAIAHRRGMGICRPRWRYYIFPNSKHFNNGFRLVEDL